MFTREEILRGSKKGAEVMRQKGHEYFVNLNKQSYEARKSRGLIKGYFYDKDGYKVIYVGGKKVREHRLFMELHLGRKLLPNEQVHHIDGVVTNNSISNLEIVDSHEHKRKFHPVSDKTKKLLSEQRLGVPKSPSHRAKMVEYLKFARSCRKPIIWSRKYRNCTSCKTNSIPHKAYGLCDKCYQVWNKGTVK